MSDDGVAASPSDGFVSATNAAPRLASLLTAASDYTPFSISVPLDPRLPGGGGQVVSGLLDLNPNKVGQVANLHELASAVGPEMINNWQGVDISGNARCRTGSRCKGHEPDRAGDALRPPAQ